MCKWLVEAGVDAIHVSTGSSFPHPRNPAGADLDVEAAVAHLRAARVERHEHVPQPAAVPQRPDGRALPQAVARRRRAEGPDRGTVAAGRARHQAGGDGAGASARAASRPRRSSGKAITDGDCDGVSMARTARRQQRPRQAVRGRPRPGRAALHVLQQVPGARRGAPARLLRGEPVPEPRGDAARKSCRSSSRRRSRDEPSSVRDSARRRCWSALVVLAAVVVVWVGRVASRPIGRRRTTTSRSTSSTGRSAASRAGRCCRRSAACCRPTGCSRRCRRSAATSCRAATPRSASSSEPGKDLPIGVSRRRRLGHRSGRASTARSATPAPSATRPARAPTNRARDAGAAARPAGVRAVRARLHARQPADRRRRPGPPAEARRAVALRARAAARRSGRSAEAADARPAEPHRADPRRRRAALGPRPRRHVQSVQGHSVQLGSEPAAAVTS